MTLRGSGSGAAPSYSSAAVDDARASCREAERAADIACDPCESAASRISAAAMSAAAARAAERQADAAENEACRTAGMRGGALAAGAATRARSAAIEARGHAVRAAEALDGRIGGVEGVFP